MISLRLNARITIVGGGGELPQLCKVGFVAWTHVQVYIVQWNAFVGKEEVFWLQDTEALGLVMVGGSKSRLEEETS